MTRIRAYVSRLLLDCVPVFHKIITAAYLLCRSGSVAIYYPEVFAGGWGEGAKIIVTPLSSWRTSVGNG